MPRLHRRQRYAQIPGDVSNRRHFWKGNFELRKPGCSKGWMTEKSGTRGKPAQGQRRRTDNGLPASSRLTSGEFWDQVSAPLWSKRRGPSSQVPVGDCAAAAREIERFRLHGVVFCGEAYIANSSKTDFAVNIERAIH
jgi:hypothetical protein